MPRIPFQSGAILGVFGRSGCGKSTYLSRLADAGLCQCSTAFLPQEDDVLGELTVSQNIELGMLLQTPLPTRKGFVDRVVAALELNELLPRQASRLSGGQRRRVAIGRVFAQLGDVVLLDEPFNGLGHLYEQRLIELIVETRQSRLLTVVVSHDYPLLCTFVDSLHMMRDGQYLGAIDPASGNSGPMPQALADTIGITNIIPLGVLQTYFTIDGPNPPSGDGVIAFWKDWATAEKQVQLTAKLRLHRRANHPVAPRLFFCEGVLYATFDLGSHLLTVRSSEIGTNSWVISVHDYVELHNA